MQRPHRPRFPGGLASGLSDVPQSSASSTAAGCRGLGPRSSEKGGCQRWAECHSLPAWVQGPSWGGRGLRAAWQRVPGSPRVVARGHSSRTGRATHEGVDVTREDRGPRDQGCAPRASFRNTEIPTRQKRRSPSGRGLGSSWAIFRLKMWGCRESRSCALLQTAP